MTIGKSTALFALLLLGPGAATAQSPDPLAGFYYIAPGGIGAGYADYYALFENGFWEYGDAYLCADDGALNEEAVPYRAGGWRRDGAILILNESARTVHTGGTCECDAIECRIVGGTVRTLHPMLDIVVDPAAACASDRDPMADLGVDLPCLTINGTGFFRLGRAEDYLP
ncbi:MAG: hypothetical protein R3F55_21370 [Alphaproteobacteria bacterium]